MPVTEQEDGSFLLTPDLPTNKKDAVTFLHDRIEASIDSVQDNMDAGDLRVASQFLATAGNAADALAALTRRLLPTPEKPLGNDTKLTKKKWLKRLREKEWFARCSVARVDGIPEQFHGACHLKKVTVKQITFWNTVSHCDDILQLQPCIRYFDTGGALVAVDDNLITRYYYGENHG